MENQKPDYNTGFSLLGTILDYAKQHGWLQIFMALIVLPIAFLVIRICYDPGWVLEKVKNYQDEQHVIEQVERIRNDAKINEILPDILYSMNASNTWIIQYHNGRSDWTFGSMRFEFPRDGVVSIKKEFVDVHLSWFLIPQYLWTHRYFIGTIEEMEPIDNCMAKLLEKFKVKYVACIILRKDNEPLGVLGVVWDNIEEVEYDKDTIRARLNNYAGKLEELLTRRNELVKL